MQQENKIGKERVSNIRQKWNPINMQYQRSGTFKFIVVYLFPYKSRIYSREQQS